MIRRDTMIDRPAICCGSAPMAGQGISWDPRVPGRLWGIVKSERVVVAGDLVDESAPKPAPKPAP